MGENLPRLLKETAEGQSELKVSPVIKKLYRSVTSQTQHNLVSDFWEHGAIKTHNTTSCAWQRDTQSPHLTLTTTIITAFVVKEIM